MKRDLDIDAMQIAARKLQGSHDFRNFAKLDVGNVSNFEREIERADIQLFEGIADCEFSTYMLEIKGNAFLWHQIRCIMAVLFLIGEGREEVTIIDELLNVEKQPAKPDYAMAPDGPLVLSECFFNCLQFPAQPRVLWDLSLHFHSILEQQLIAVARTRNALKSIENMMVRNGDVDDFKAELIDSFHDRFGLNYKKMRGEVPMTSLSSSSSSSSLSLSSSSSSSMPKLTKWHDVLQELSDVHISVHTAQKNASINGNSCKYTKLLDRNRNDSYEKRCSQLTGTKKERLKRHLQLKEENKDTDFFVSMRNEGGIDLVTLPTNTYT